MPHPLSKEKMATLREVTNNSVADSHLRRVLIRCSGNVDAAASALITESAGGAMISAPSALSSRYSDSVAATVEAAASSKSRSRHEAAEKLSKEHANAQRAQPATNAVNTLPKQTAEIVSMRNTITPDAKRAAWRHFYLARRDEAVRAVGTDKKLIDKYIAQAWSDMGSSSRREYVHQLTCSPLSREDIANQSTNINCENDSIHKKQLSNSKPLTQHTQNLSSPGQNPYLSMTAAECPNQKTSAPAPASEGEMKEKGCSIRDDAPLPDTSRNQLDDHSALNPPGDSSDLNQNAHISERVDLVVQPICTDKRTIREVMADDDNIYSNLSNDSDKILPVMPARENLDAETEWPRKLTSRLCRGVMLVRGGGRNTIAAGDELLLEAPPPAKRILPTGRGKRRLPTNPVSSPKKIVRFCKNGRELGRLAPDIGKALAPALISGFLSTTCKVVTPPEDNNIFAEVILDVTVSLNEEAFGPQDNAKIEGGYEGENGDDDTNQTDRGIDARRLSIVNFITSLQICELSSSKDVHLALNNDPDCGDAGAVKEENVEEYYRTVTAIDERDAESFVQSKYLASTLREYQKVGVKWMISREKLGNLTRMGKNHATSDFVMNPLWKKRGFPDGGIFYMNTSTGNLSLAPPSSASGGPYGGILADEMGLGKTVQCIACIIHDEEEQRCSDLKRESSPEGNNDISKQSLAEVDVEMVKGEGVDKTRSPGFSERKVDTKNTDASTPILTSDGDDTTLLERSSRSLTKKKSNRACGASALRPEGEGADKPSLTSMRLRSRRSALVKSELEGDGKDYSSRKDDIDGRDSDEGSKDIRDSEDGSSEDGDSCNRDAATKPTGVNRPTKRVRRSLLDVRSNDRSNPDVFEEDEGELKSDDTAGNNFRFGKGTRISGTEDCLGSTIKKSAVEVLMSTVPNDERGRKGGTLIVCPTSLVTQWVNEFETHVRSRFLRVVTHYGHMRGDQRSICREAADVVVTTYGIIASEFVDDAKDNGKNRTSTSGPIFQLEWRRVILDEAHTIKSRVTRWAKAAYHLTAERRWCVTGTVIHNHVNDVFSLLHFLQLKPWSSWAFWNRGVAAKLEGKDVSSQKIAMALVRDIVSSITLRRKKTTLDSLGRPIVSLTKKTVELVTLTPSPEEWDFYAALENRSKVKFSTFLAQGKVMNNYASVLELLLRLRQACDHPYLVFAAAPSKDTQLLKDKEKLYKAFTEGGSSSQYVDSVLNHAENGKIQECPICLDVIEDAVAPRECGHPACRGCLLSQLRHSNKCPVCRTRITAESVTTLLRNSRFSVDLEKRWRSSVKIETLLREVRDRRELRIKNSKSIGKTVVFSQFTSMLDLVQHALAREHFLVMRIDGSVPQAQRATILEKFDSEDELDAGTANILLVSLRAGGVGLNLVSASHAILLDIHWNPQVDAQAQDRIHRHGQVRDVLVRRYVIEKSVEQRLLAVQSRKQDLADGALDMATDEDKKQARLSELKLLFAS